MSHVCRATKAAARPKTLGLARFSQEYIQSGWERLDLRLFQRGRVVSARALDRARNGARSWARPSRVEARSKRLSALFQRLARFDHEIGKRNRET